MTTEFAKLTQYAPKLLELRERCRHWTNEDEDRYYLQVRGEISQCVGWYAKPGYPDFMYTPHSYDIALSAIVSGHER